MGNLRQELEKERKKTIEVINITKKLLDSINPSKGIVRVMVKGKSVQFYLRECEEDGKNGRYLHANEKEKAIDIIKAEYYNKTLCKSKDREKVIKKLLMILDETDVTNIYNNMAKGKQKVLQPIVMSDEEFRKEWESVNYNGKPFYEGSTEIYTEKGERVRSKSEKIIADKLYSENIPYRYEYPLEVPSFGVLYPDFTILDMKNRKNIILEHLGMMDDEEYANKAVGKIQTYAKNGWILGDNLLVTMETTLRPFDCRVLDGIINNRFKV